MYMKVDDPFSWFENLIHPKTGAEKDRLLLVERATQTYWLEMFQNEVER